MGELFFFFDLIKQYSSETILILLGVGVALEKTSLKPITNILKWIGGKLNEESNKEIKEEIYKLKNQFVELQEEQDGFKKSFKNLNEQVEVNHKELLEIRAKEIRTKLFEFASNLERGICYPKDNFVDMFELHDEYLTILKYLEKTNGATDITMKTINERYEICLKTCQFTKMKENCKSHSK